MDMVFSGPFDRISRFFGQFLQSLVDELVLRRLLSREFSCQQFLVVLMQVELWVIQEYSNDFFLLRPIFRQVGRSLLTVDNIT